MTRALVTGAAGFIGANLVRRLLADGCDVRGLVRPGSDRWRLDGLDVSVGEADLTDVQCVREAVARATPDWIFHLAAHGAYSWQHDDQTIIRANVLGTTNVVAAALETRLEALVVGGTSSEYGALDYAPDEDTPPNPATTYALTKAFATAYCRHVARDQGLPISVLRLYSVYGPFEEPRRLVPQLISEALEGRWPPLANPDAAHDFVYVEDVCDIFVRVATRPSVSGGQIYNIGSGKQTTLREVVDAVKDALSVAVAPEWNSMPGRPWDTEFWCANPDKVRRDLGWSASTELADGIGQFAAWLESDADRRLRYAR